MCQTLELTKKRLEKVANLFERLQDSETVDDTIKKAIKQFPKNDSKVGVYTKAILINTLYRTAIIDISKLANHIFEKREIIDERLEAGDITVIDDIRHGHDIRRKKKEMDFYCFATKYAHFHKPRSFPIYDNLVMRLLSNVNKIMKFHEKFNQEYLKGYENYKLVVDSLARPRCLDITEWDYKKIDQGLWLWAKYLYKGKSLPLSVQKELKDIIKR